MHTSIDNRLIYGGKIYTGALDGQYRVMSEPRMTLVTRAPGSDVNVVENFIFVDSGERAGKTALGAWVPHWMSMERLARTLLAEAHRVKEKS